MNTTLAHNLLIISLELVSWQEPLRATVAHNRRHDGTQLSTACNDGHHNLLQLI